MDELRIEGALFFPTLGVGMEQALINDLPAARAAFRAFNRWMDDDWGFAYKDRIYGVPYLTLSDLDNALAELEWVLDRDARVVLIGTGPVMTAEGLKSPADPRFDPFYEEANRRGAVMLIHPMVPAGIETMNQYALGPLVGFMFDTTLAVSRLIFSNFFGRFLGIHVIAAHLGGDRGQGGEVRHRSAR